MSIESTSLILASICAVGLLACGPSEEHDTPLDTAPSIEAFGEDGHLTPTLMAHGPSDDFFDKSMTVSMEHGSQYTATVDLAALPRSAGMTLVLVNNESFDADIVVSTKTQEGSTRNYLVRVPPGDHQRINIDPLRGSDWMYLLSRASFAAHVEAAFPEPAHTTIDLDVDPPDPEQELRGFTGSYCHDDSRWLHVGDANATVPAYFTRSYDGDFSCTNNDGSYTSKGYSLYVYWPDPSTLHHDGSDFGSNPICGPDCIMFQYSTRSNTNSNVLSWTGGQGAVLYPFDDVMRGLRDGKAKCHSSIKEGPDCTGGNDATWYVYRASQN